MVHVKEMSISLLPQAVITSYSIHYTKLYDRYDGYNYKIFRHKESIGHSIADNFVDLIQEDADGNLWIHTGVGYVFFDSKKEVFVNNLAEIMKGFGINHIPSVVYIDEDKNFWFYVMNLGGFSYLTKTT